MADDKRGMRRQEYPIRMDISRPGPAQAPVSNGAAAGRAVRRAAANQIASTPVAQALALASAIGSSIIPRATEFMSGVTGIRPVLPEASTAKPAMQVAAIPRQPAVAVAPKAQRQPTPQERMLAYVDTLLRGPVTLREAQAAAGMIPAPTKPVSAKDKIAASAANIADTQFQLDLAATQKMQAGEEQDAARAKAADAYFRRQAALLGVNPMQLAMQDMLEQQGAQ